MSRASQAAIAAVERQGGSVVTAYYNELGLRVLLRPEKYDDRLKPRRALPSKKDMPYYLSEKNRGYLLTESGQQRLAEAGIAGCYVDADGRVAVPGKPTTEGAAPAPTKEEYLKVCSLFCCIINYVFCRSWQQLKDKLKLLQRQLPKQSMVISGKQQYSSYYNVANIISLFT